MAQLEVKKLTPEHIRLANSLAWYHALEFGEYQTIGRIAPPNPPNMTLFGVMDILSNIDVSGFKCLDVGPAHGLVSFGLALRGGIVTAINIGGAKPPQIRLAEEIYGVELEYLSPVSLEQAPRVFQPATFDLIVCAGVMYHLLNPADVFFRLRPLLKRNGLLVVETVYEPNRNDPVLVLNSETGKFNQPTTYFIPTAEAIRGLARLSCFNILATRANSPVRFSLIGRAVLPDEVEVSTELLKKMLAMKFEDPLFDTGALGNAPSSRIRYGGAHGHMHLDVKSYAPSFPSHPVRIVNPLGKPITAG